MKKAPVIWDLLLTFIKIGLFTFGGGYAMLSLVENSCVEEKRWITHDDMMSIAVIAESTPGSIAINCATFVGYRQAGLAGSIAATLGVVLPSFAVIELISVFLDDFLAVSVVSNAFRGIRIAVGILILKAAISMIRKMERSRFSCLILAGSFITMLLVNVFSWKFSSISLILIVAAISLAASLAKGLPGREGGAGK